MKNQVPGYEELERILALAYERAAAGKGKERHAEEAPFPEQFTPQALRRYGISPALYQIEKKTREVPRRATIEEQMAELLDVITIAAMAVLELKRQGGSSIDPGRVPEEPFYFGDATIEPPPTGSHSPNYGQAYGGGGGLIIGGGNGGSR